jgi:hypothetical protein
MMADGDAFLSLSNKLMVLLDVGFTSHMVAMDASRG